MAALVTLAGCASSASPTTTTSDPPDTTDPFEGRATVPTTGGSSTPSVTAPGTTSPPTTLAGGGWAEVPAVASAWGAMGWWDGEAWVVPAQAPEVDLTGRYRLVGLGEESEAQADAVDDYCHEEAGGVVPRPELPWGEGSPFPEWPVAISAPWDLHSEVEIIDGQPDVYVEAVAEFLSSRGLAGVEPELVQVLETDLQGDGSDEVLIVAESIANAPSLLATEGDYSVALFREVVDGRLHTVVLAESVVAELAPGETPFVLSMRVPAVADLNGDGTAEIVLVSAYYEGSGIEVYEYREAAGPTRVLLAGCGV